MKIRSKLAWTYIILLIIGIITISTYSILSIRTFLLKEGIVQFENDAYSMALAASRLDADGFEEDLEQLSGYTGWTVSAYDKSGIRFAKFPDDSPIDTSAYLDGAILAALEISAGDSLILNALDSELLVAYLNIENDINPAAYLKISQLKSNYYASISNIRHIIYSGMLFSIIAVVIVSFMFARYMAAPIQYLNEAALDIAEGDMDRKIKMNRSDEFGTLSDSLNKMSTRLRQDNEKLMKMNEKQQQFYADITHEIRNPLHTILGSLEMMELDNLDAEKKQKYLNTSKRQAIRLSRLFEDIKTLQRYDVDSSFLKKELTDIEALAMNVVETYYILAEEKGLELKVNSDGMCQAEVDPDKMEQVLDNLVSNAIKYSNKGTIEIRIKKEKDGRLCVSVSDEGEGIDQEHFEKLFDRFYRTDKARSRDKGGTGLGLSIVKSILRAHDSDIEVTSKAGNGSIFFFHLPA